MEKILICPGERPAVSFLAQTLPLVAVPILGESLVNRWIEHLAHSGARKILVLATDRPESVRSAVGDGSRWGVEVRIEAAMREPTAGEVCAGKVKIDDAFVSSGRGRDVIEMEHLPGLEGMPLFRSYGDWFAGVLAWMALQPKLQRIGVRERERHVWCGRRTQVASTAKLCPPCWLGEHVQVGPNAVVGPNAIVEDHVVIDSAVEIEESLVGPDTFVGALIKLEGSIAWGSTLIDWRNGSCTQVPDPFLLCALGQGFVSRPQYPRTVLQRLRHILGGHGSS